MRVLTYCIAAIALAAVVPPNALREALATSASALFEATPFLIGGVVLARAFRAWPQASALLGCGCGPGPSARSLPAAAATWLIFGPWIACARLLAAFGVARFVARRCEHRDGKSHGVASVLGDLAAVLPAAAIAGAAMQIAGPIDLRHAAPFAAAAIGALLGFTASSCGFGSVAVAGALHARAPMAAAAFLCVSGIVDMRAVTAGRNDVRVEHDGFAYALLAIALGVVAWKHGDGLVHPAIAAVLAFAAVAMAGAALVHRARRSASVRWAPALMLAGALLTPPPPAYYATETTLTDLFAGEHLRFTGSLVRDGRSATLVRYAITCCRADAAPVAVRLSRDVPYAPGSWLSADGVVLQAGTALVLDPKYVAPIAAPRDPFIYR